MAVAANGALGTMGANQKCLGLVWVVGWIAPHRKDCAPCIHTHTLAVLAVRGWTDGSTQINAAFDDVYRACRLRCDGVCRRHRQMQDVPAKAV